MDINYSYEDSGEHGSKQHVPSTQSPLLTASGKKYYGLGNPTKSTEVDLSLSNVYHNKYGNEPPNYASRICTTIWLLLVFLIVAGLITAFAVFHYIPGPSATTTQGVFQGNTVPLYLTNFQELPHSINTYWYLTVSVELIASSKANQEVSLIFHEGERVCYPIADHNDTMELKLTNKTFEKFLTTLEYQYLTIDDELTVNVSVTSEKNNKISVYILNSVDSYKCFTSGRGIGNETGCGFVETHYIVGSDVFLFVPQAQGYYFVVLMSESKVTVDYSHRVFFHYYNQTDYDTIDSQSCDINSTKSQCSLSLGGIKGCLFAYGVINGTESYIPLRVQVDHNVWNLPGLCCLAVGAALLILTFSIVLLKYGCNYIIRH